MCCKQDDMPRTWFVPLTKHLLLNEAHTSNIHAGIVDNEY